MDVEFATALHQDCIRFADFEHAAASVKTCEVPIQVLRAGLRLENDYVVTETGIENLSPFSLEL
jgi:hypothetical protein